MNIRLVLVAFATIVALTYSEELRAQDAADAGVTLQETVGADALRPGWQRGPASIDLGNGMRYALPEG
jgi:uncharacterized membrane-anchored protein